VSGWGVWRTEAGKEGQWFLDGGTGKPYVYATESEAHSVMHGLRLLLPKNTYEALPMPDDQLTLDQANDQALLAASDYIEALESAAGMENYLLTGKNRETYPQAAACLALRAAWEAAQKTVAETEARTESLSRR
jgi:hypothetical protein